MALPTITFAGDATEDTVERILTALKGWAVRFVLSPLDDSEFSTEVYCDIIQTSVSNDNELLVDVIEYRDDIEQRRLLRVASITDIVIL